MVNDRTCPSLSRLTVQSLALLVRMFQVFRFSALQTLTPAVLISDSNVFAASSKPPTAVQQSLSRTMSASRPSGQPSRRWRTDQLTQCDLASPQHKTLSCFASVSISLVPRADVGSSGTSTSALSALYISARLFWPLKYQLMERFWATAHSLSASKRGGCTLWPSVPRMQWSGQMTRANLPPACSFSAYSRLHGLISGCFASHFPELISSGVITEKG